MRINLLKYGSHRDKPLDHRDPTDELTALLADLREWSDGYKDTAQNQPARALLLRLDDFAEEQMDSYIQFVANSAEKASIVIAISHQDN